MTDRLDTLTDARGCELACDPYPRVVSLVPSLTETVCRLGALERLTARTIYCVEPRGDVAGIPACGGTKNPDLDKILFLEPDLVLACVEENKPEHLAVLEEAGIPVYACMPRTLDDVSTLLRDLGRLLEVQEAAGRAVADLTSARLAAGEFRNRCAGQGDPLRAATLIWTNPWMAAGGGHHIDAMMKELGLVNLLCDREGYFQMDLQELAAMQPDLVLLPDEPFPFSHRHAWSLAAAEVLPDKGGALLLDGKLLSWYGTRTARSLRSLIKLLEDRQAE